MNTRTLLVMLGAAALTACGGGGSESAAPTSNPQPVVVAPPVSEALSGTPPTWRWPTGSTRVMHEHPRASTWKSAPAVSRALWPRDTSAIPTSPPAPSRWVRPTRCAPTTWHKPSIGSERQATWQEQYSDLVEVRSDARLFEVVRVPRADLTAMLRHRVFRCDYVDRAGSDLRNDSGAAGLMNQRPLNASELEKLAEYLRQFTMYNNADFAVESSVTTTNGNSIVQTIRMGQLIRGSAGCDTVQLVDWTHTLNTSDGSLSRALASVRSFGVKNTLAGVAGCAI